ncbi:MAG: lyase [Clostridiaceae bacterium]|jgi:HEAT repeat protein|nr:lyase [Clostridiaceae bacterium]
MNLFHIHWDKIHDIKEEDITYYLFLENKPIEAICKIRGLDIETVKSHILYGKIKYGTLVKSKNEKELIKNISLKAKEEKRDILETLQEENKAKLMEYIKSTYADMEPKEKEAAVWIIGELKAESCLNILARASVHKFVNIRRMAVSAMGKIGDKSSEAALIRALDDSNPQVVTYAIKALIKIKSYNAKGKIEEIINSSGSKEYVKGNAKRFLELCNKDFNAEDC